MLTMRKTGFTLVEMLIVIAIISILAAVSYVGYRGVTAKAANTQLENDASSVSDMLELSFVKNGVFPADLTSLGQLKTDSKTTVAYQVSSDGKSYCLTTSRTGYTSYVARDDANVTEGNCSGWTPVAGGGGSAPGQPVASINTTTTNSITVTWPAASGATGYIVRYGTSSPTSVASCSASPCTVSSLSANTTYYANVTASNSVGSTTSATANGLTKIPPPASASVSYTKSTVKIGSNFYRRYAMTASGGACSIGSTEWQINVTGVVPQFGTWPWQSGNTKTQDISENGQYSPDDVTIYATPRCVSGSNITTGDTATAISGSGGAYL